MNILEEYWYGTLNTAEYDTCPNEEYKEILRRIGKNEDKLPATMADTQKDFFSWYQDCVREHQAMAECLLFQNSFRLDAKMMIDVLNEE